MSAAIELRHVGKRYGTTTVLNGLDLTVADRSITALLGASGSGKTTTLRLIAGFDRVDAGSITMGGQTVDDGRRFLRPQDRHIGYVAQDGALFPHLTVAANIGFGVRRHARTDLRELIDMVGLSGLERRYPHQLSGGQQQRVALARALATHPRVLLLDEPFASLDASLRDSLRRDVITILTRTATTTILVTHDQDEALGLADQIAVIRGGQLVAAASPRDLYIQPPDLAAAMTIGEANLLPAQLHGDHARCLLGDIPLRDRPNTPEPSPDRTGQVMLRPEQLELHLEARMGGVPATVIDTQYHGHDALIRVRPNHPGNVVLLVRTPGELSVSPGQAVWIEATGSAQAWAGPPSDNTHNPPIAAASSRKPPF